MWWKTTVKLAPSTRRGYDKLRRVHLYPRFRGRRITSIDWVEVELFAASMLERVIVAGLDQDYLGKPFEPMPQLLAIAEYITKTLAICVVCGEPANHTQRLVNSSERVLVGAQGTYEARCRACFDPRLAG